MGHSVAVGLVPGGPPRRDPGVEAALIMSAASSDLVTNPISSGTWAACHR